MGDSDPRFQAKENTDRWELNPSRLEVSHGSQGVVRLTAKEFQIFSLLIASPEAGVERSRILSVIWDRISVSPKTLDVHMHNLRRKLDLIGIEIRLREPDTYILGIKGPSAGRELHASV